MTQHYLKLGRHGAAIAQVPADIEPGELVIKGSGIGYSLMCRGAPIEGAVYGRRELAIQAANAIEYQARLTPRACLCCGASFKSEGTHHRMCDGCRTYAKSLG